MCTEDFICERCQAGKLKTTAMIINNISVYDLFLNKWPIWYVKYR